MPSLYRVILCGLMLSFGIASSFTLLNVAAQDTGEKTKNFADSPLQLPAAPKPEKLLSFYSNDHQNFFIDSESLSIVADGSLRYTMVAVSQSGAKNISYEGLRCDSYQKTLFAFGRTDGSWSLSRRKEWDAISNQGINKQHSTLAWDFVCDGNSIAGNIDKILHRIRRNESLKQHR